MGAAENKESEAGETTPENLLSNKTPMLLVPAHFIISTMFQNSERAPVQPLA